LTNPGNKLKNGPSLFGSITDVVVKESLWMKNLLLLTLCLGGVSLLAYFLMGSERIEQPLSFQPSSPAQRDIEDVARSVDAAFERRWSELDLSPAERAETFTVARRLSLGLAGTIPSLEEIREIEKQEPADRIHWWVCRLLEDKRTSNHLAERMARALVGVEDGPFLVFRRRRFASWLSEQIAANRPYDELVTHILTDEGLWTDTPAVNFYTRTITEDDESRPDPILLAGRTSRAFLGMRIDCLQCHDDFLGTINLGSPEDLTGGMQQDFHSLAAYFQQTGNSLLGIRDEPDNGDYEYKLLDQDEAEAIPPQVPFHHELVDNQEPNLRWRLAKWVTHNKNRPFARATINRVWAIMFSKALMQPVDDIPLAGPFPAAMEVLVDDFVEHNFDLHRLIRIIAATHVFQLDSAAEFAVTSEHENEWTVFPLVRLRPDQVAGGIIQSTSLSTIDSTAHIITQLTRFGEQNDFVQRFGDPGENEFRDRGETVTQRLLMLNGNMIDDRLGNGLNTPINLSQLSPDCRKTVEIIYLSTLSRRPSETELNRFATQLDALSGRERDEKAVDLYWALINSAEFRWNH
jgi:hypothetical protein